MADPREPQRIESLNLTPADSIATAAAAAEGMSKNPCWKRFSGRQFDNGAFWEAEENRGLASGANSLNSMVSEMREVRAFLEKHTRLSVSEEQKNWFVRRLIIITLMVRFLEDRKILPVDYFKDQEFLGAENFTSLLLEPRALLRAISRLEHDFNGDVFHVDLALREILSTIEGSALTAIANFATGNMEGQQQHFWKRYSFKHLPVEVISYIYEDFLGGKSQAYFTPYYLVDLLLDEAMPESEILATLHQKEDVTSPRRGCYVIEAKRLPTPSRAGQGDRTREYVVGEWNNFKSATKNRTGGIERFKEGLHGAAFDRSAMVAFVQRDTPENWLGRVNSWIQDLITNPIPCHQSQWTKDDFLLQISLNSTSCAVSEFQSKHLRANGAGFIKLRHYWIMLN